VTVTSIEHRYQPDYFSSERKNNGYKTYESALVVVEVDGVAGTLSQRAYQYTKTINGLRLYVECTREWSQAGIAAVGGIEREVRLSACGAKESWGPDSMVFPIGDFRWRSSPYNNTWSSIVQQPSNLYFHRGDDFGAIPDVLPVRAINAGVITQTPLPDGPEGSNPVYITMASGIRVRNSHMNYDQIEPDILLDTPVEAGQKLGKTGETWNGKKLQKNDPHFHIDFRYMETKLSTYPAIVETYLRSYPDDPVICNAGGYVFGTVGSAVTLDGTRSVCRHGHEIRGYRWRLSNGREFADSVISVVYETPGFYAEELTVYLENGDSARDIASLRIYEPNPSQRQKGFAGFIYHTPVRGIEPGRTVSFRVRLLKNVSSVIDFGDGTPPLQTSGTMTHHFEKPGIYTVSCTSTGDDPFSVRSVVVVEPPTPTAKITDLRLKDSSPRVRGEVFSLLGRTFTPAALRESALGAYIQHGGRSNRYIIIPTNKNIRPIPSSER